MVHWVYCAYFTKGYLLLFTYQSLNHLSSNHSNFKITAYVQSVSLIIDLFLTIWEQITRCNIFEGANLSIPFLFPTCHYSTYCKHIDNFAVKMCWLWETIVQYTHWSAWVEQSHSQKKYCTIRISIDNFWMKFKFE